MIGRIIGNYQITDELANGSLGMIYRGHHVNLSREVVVKEVLLSHFPISTRVQLKARFRREAFIYSQFDFPGIVRLYEAFARGDNYYLVMEYVQGISLRELLERQGLPTPAQAIYLCKQALAALDYAHNFKYLTESDVQCKGVIHRDLKPANLLIDGRGRLKLTDFGIVRMPDRDSMAPPSFKPGTTEYMPPEQLRGLEVDVRSDIYSLGVTFHEMLTGQLPFYSLANNADDDVRSGLIDPGPITLAEIRPDIAPPLAAIFTRAITRNPSERFQTASEFLKSIKEYERSSGTVETPSKLLTAKPADEPDDSVTIVDITPMSETPALPSVTQVASSTPAPSITLSSQQFDLQNQTKIDTFINRPQTTRGSNSQVDVAAEGLMMKVTEPALKPQRTSDSKPGFNLRSQIGSFNTSLEKYSNGETRFEHFRNGSRGPHKIVTTAAAAIVFLGLLTSGYLLLQRQERAEKSVAPLEQDGATNVASPMTAANAATPEPEQSVAQTTSGDVDKLEQAREADRLGKFKQAVALYDQYLRSGPTDSDTAIIADQAGKLKKFVAHVNAARAAYNRQDYQTARQNYNQARKLRPYSKMVLNGIARSNARLSGTPGIPNENFADPPPPPPKKPDPQ